MTPFRRVTIVVPARNEAAGIASTLAALPVQTLQAAGYETDVVVLDGHSTDATADIARQWGAVVVADRGRGKGSAVRDARAQLRGEFVIMLDADGTYAADAIPRVVDMLAHGDADLVMGDRVPLRGSMTRLHRAGNALLSLGASILFGQRVRDVCTGLWGFRRDALRMLPLRRCGFELEAQLFALSARLRLRIRHALVDYLPRAGLSKLTLLDGLRIGWCLLWSRFARVRATGAPTRFAAAPGPSR